MSLLKAREAIAYVRDTCRIKANNRDSDRRHPLEVSYEVAKFLEAGHDASQYKSVDYQKAALFPAMSHVREAEGSYESLRMLQVEAAVIRKLKVGNCLEMAKVAFVYLANAGIKPLELVACRPKSLPASKLPITGVVPEEDIEADHAFVLIHRTRTEPKDEAALSPHTKWQGEVVICDPWARRAYTKWELEEEMALIKRVTAGQTLLESDVALLRDEVWHQIPKSELDTYMTSLDAQLADSKSDVARLIRKNLQ